MLGSVSIACFALVRFSPGSDENLTMIDVQSVPHVREQARLFTDWDVLVRLVARDVEIYLVALDTIRTLPGVAEVLPLTGLDGQAWRSWATFQRIRHIELGREQLALQEAEAARARCIVPSSRSSS